MSRKDRVYRVLIDMGRTVSWKDLNTKDRVGFSADRIATELGIMRSNVSRELNELAREGRAVRISGRPVFFLARTTVEGLLGRPLRDDELQVSNTRELFQKNARIMPVSKSQSTRIAERMVGSRGSLRMQVEQAKAAVLYPPQGLPALIIGPTGTGKSTFAEMMYQFALDFGRLSSDAPFTVFNCADYADNPQLLLGQLFGHTKGAFTGAHRNSPGLVERSHRGMLFLDEVHRLPPEGQEMLFQLIDKGTYRRLGASGEPRQAEVFLVAATTEEPTSSLLDTFLRRIPMVIRLPSLAERPLSERAMLIKQFFEEEVHRVRASIEVSREVIKALLSYDCRGNVGQLRSDVQLLCARAFLNYMTNGDDVLKVDDSLLGDHLKRGLLKREVREYDVDLIQEKTYLFTRGDPGADTSQDLYQLIGERWSYYQGRGFSQEKIKQIFREDIERYFKNLLGGADHQTPEGLLKVVSPEVIQAVQTAIKVAEKKLSKQFDDNVRYGLAIHISTLMERLRLGRKAADLKLDDIAVKHPLEFRTAKLVRNILNEELKIDIPDSEVGFIAMFLYAVGGSPEVNAAVGIIVMAHGPSTASSMLEVAQKLLGTNHGVAIDMPLERGIDDTLRQTIKTVEKVDRGKGVLLLVDMGSLAAFPEVITRETGIPVRAVKMVSTPMVVEAIRKALLPSSTLDSLVLDITDLSPLIGQTVTEAVSRQTKARGLILASCISGEGTAKKIAQMIRNALPPLPDVQIKPVALKDRSQPFPLGHDNPVIAVVGTVDLKLDGIPYIPIDELITGNGLEQLSELIGCKVSELDFENAPTGNILLTALQDTLTFLNPRKVYDLLLEAFLEISTATGLPRNEALKLKFLLHCGCMLERLIKGEQLSYSGAADVVCSYPGLASLVDRALEKTTDAFLVHIPDTEKAYVIDLLNTHCNDADTQSATGDTEHLN